MVGATTTAADLDVPVSGRVIFPCVRGRGPGSGNLRRPRRYHRGLQRSLYLSSQVAVYFCPVSKAFYDRKLAEVKGHKQAVLALARRRTNVLWAMIRDKTELQAAPRAATA